MKNNDKSMKIFILFRYVRKVLGLKKQAVKTMNANSIETAIFLFLIYEKNITQKKIVDRLALAKQSINNVIVDLYDKGYVESRLSKEDKRTKILVLTKNGRAYAKKLLGPLVEFNEKLYDKLGEEKLEKLYRDLEELGACIEEINEEVL